MEESHMVAAYIFVSVEPGKNAAVLGALRKAPSVQQAHICWGVPDIFAFVEVADDEALSDLVMKEIQSIPGIRGTETHLVVPDSASPAEAVKTRRTAGAGRAAPKGPGPWARAMAQPPKSRKASAKSAAATAAASPARRRRTRATSPVPSGEPGIEGVPEGVADEVEGEDRREDRDTRKRRNPR